MKKEKEKEKEKEERSKNHLIRMRVKTKTKTKTQNAANKQKKKKNHKTIDICLYVCFQLHTLFISHYLFNFYPSLIKKMQMQREGQKLICLDLRKQKR